MGEAQQSVAGLKREGETALDGPLALSEIKCAAITRQEWAISLRQQIAHIYQRLGSVGQQVATVDSWRIRRFRYAPCPKLS